MLARNRYTEGQQWALKIRSGKCRSRQSMESLTAGVPRVWTNNLEHTREQLQRISLKTGYNSSVHQQEARLTDVDGRRAV